MVPFLGWGATGTKIGIKGFKAARAVEETGLAGKGVKDGPELPSSNRSHLAEDLSNDYFGP
jgi:hypothetical protein